MSSLLERRRKIETTEVMDRVKHSYLSLPTLTEIAEGPLGDGSVCGTSVLMSLFGPEDMSMSDPVGHKDSEVFWRKVEELGDDRDWSYCMPSSAHEFTSMMEQDQGVVGAVIISSQFIKGRGDVGHVMVVLKTWVEEEERVLEKVKRRWVEGRKNPRLRECFLLHDTSSILGRKLIEVDDDGLVDLYTEAILLADGERAIVVLVED
jgi:hypothetical protein